MGNFFKHLIQNVAVVVIPEALRLSITSKLENQFSKNRQYSLFLVIPSESLKTIVSAEQEFLPVLFLPLYRKKLCYS